MIASPLLRLLFVTGWATMCAWGAEGDWTMAPKDYANTRYSSLDQITADNVSSLRVAWTFGTGVNRGQESAPIGRIEPI